MTSRSSQAGVISDLGLRSVTDIPEKYQHFFSRYPCFNAIQSKLLDFILETDESLVVSAPTGSGKTVLFELAIIRLLMLAEDAGHGSEAKIVYMAPVKALVSEKFNDWVDKFSSLGVRCLEVTGDSDFMSLRTITDYQLILTTPEKWDSMTRLWTKSSHLGIIQQVRLFLIDEVHLLNEERRGSTLEAVVSRMKTVQNSIDRSGCGLRFVAVSATIPNGEDLAVWLGSNNRPAKFAKIGEDMRPVKLKKVVLGFRHDEFKTSFAFDMSLSYNLKNIILKYSNGKPTLVFCNSRKSVQTTSSILVKQIKFQTQGSGQQILIDAANQISDVVLADLLKAGIGNHHAGMALEDRKLMEQLFRDGKLPVLITTSTLAMGVNLPAHLVVIKSTECYMQNEMKPYTDSQILQMIGRAGRPQFDTSAVAVIMTKTNDKVRDQALILRGGEYSVKLSLEGVRDVNEIEAHLISTTVVGLDVVTKLKMSGSPPSPTRQKQQNVQTSIDKYMKKRKHLVREKSPKIRKVDKKEAKRQSNLSFNMDKFVCRAKNKKSITELFTNSPEAEGNAQEMRTSPLSDNSSHGRSEHIWSRMEEEEGGIRNEEEQIETENLVEQFSDRLHHGLDSDTDSGFNSVQVQRKNCNKQFMAGNFEGSKENFDSNSLTTIDSNNNDHESEPEIDVVEQICNKYKGPNSIFKWTKRIPRFSQPKVELVRRMDQSKAASYEEKLFQGICDKMSSRISAQRDRNPLGNKFINIQSTRKAQSNIQSTKITDYLDRSLRSFTPARSLISPNAPKSTISEPVHSGRRFGMPLHSDQHDTSYSNIFQPSRASRDDIMADNTSVGGFKPPVNDLVSITYKPYEAPDRAMNSNNNRSVYPSTSNQSTRSNEMLGNHGASSKSKETRRQSSEKLVKDSPVSMPNQTMFRIQVEGEHSEDSNNFRQSQAQSGEIRIEDSQVTDTRMFRTQVAERQLEDYSNFRVPKVQEQEILKKDFPVGTSGTSEAHVIRIETEKSSDDDFLTHNKSITVDVSDSADIGDMKVPLVSIENEKDCENVGYDQRVTFSGEIFEENHELDQITITTDTTHQAPRLDSEVSSRPVDQIRQIVENFELRNTKFFPIFFKTSKDLLSETGKNCDEKVNELTPRLNNQECEKGFEEENNVQDSQQYSSKMLNSNQDKIDFSPNQSRSVEVPQPDSATENCSQATSGLHLHLENQDEIPYISTKQSSNALIKEVTNMKNNDSHHFIQSMDVSRIPQNDSYATSNGSHPYLENQSTGIPNSSTAQSSNTAVKEVSNNDSHYFCQSMVVSNISYPNEQDLASDDDCLMLQVSGNLGENIQVLHLNKTTDMTELHEDLEVSSLLHSGRATGTGKDTYLSRIPEDSVVEDYSHHHRSIQNRRDTANLSRYSKKSQVYSSNTNMGNPHYNRSQMRHNQHYEMTNLNDHQNSTSYHNFEPKMHYTAQELPPTHAEKIGMHGAALKILENSHISHDFYEEYQAEKQCYGVDNDQELLHHFSQESSFMLEKIMDDFENGCLRPEENTFNIYEVVNGADNKFQAAITQNYRTDDNYLYKSGPGHEFQPNNSNSRSQSESHDEEEFVTIDELLAQNNCSQKSTTVESMTDAQVLEQRGNSQTGKYKVPSQAQPEPMKYTSNISSYQSNNMESIEKCLRFLKNQEETMKYKVDKKNKPTSTNCHKDTEFETGDELLIWDTNRSKYIPYGGEQTSEKVHEGMTWENDISRTVVDKSSKYKNYSKRELIDHSNTAQKQGNPITNFVTSKVSKLYKETHDSVDEIYPVELSQSPVEFSPPTAYNHDNTFEDVGNLQGTDLSFCSEMKTEETDHKFETSALKLFEKCNTRSKKFGCWEDCDSHSSKVLGGACGCQEVLGGQHLRSGCQMMGSLNQCQGLMKKSSCMMQCACGSGDVSEGRYNMPSTCTGRRDLSCACHPVNKPSCQCFATRRHRYFADSAPCTQASSYPSCHVANSGACANRCSDVISRQPIVCSCCSGQCCLPTSQMRRCCCYGDGGQSQGGSNPSVGRDLMSTSERELPATDLATTSPYPFSTRATTSSCGCYNSCETLSQSFSQH